MKVNGYYKTRQHYCSLRSLKPEVVPADNRKEAVQAGLGLGGVSSGMEEGSKSGSAVFNLLTINARLVYQ
jgi:hypothetical protein